MERSAAMLILLLMPVIAVTPSVSLATWQRPGSILVRDRGAACRGARGVGPRLVTAMFFIGFLLLPLLEEAIG